MSYSETSYQNWIQAQLEPDGIIIVGKMKREPEGIKPDFKYRADEQIKNMEWEEADNKKQDEYLRKHGIY